MSDLGAVGALSIKDLYNNFTTVNDASQRRLEEIKYENTVKEQAMNDPLYIGKTYLNQNIETSEVHNHAWKMKIRNPRE